MGHIKERVIGVGYGLLLGSTIVEAAGCCVKDHLAAAILLGRKVLLKYVIGDLAVGTWQGQVVIGDRTYLTDHEGDANRGDYPKPNY